MANLNQNEVTIKIEEILNRIKSLKRTKWCIYRVPNNIRELNEAAYTPQEISIGPFHYGNERLQNMQTLKWTFFKKFIERTNTKVVDLVSIVEELEPSIRQCYAENIELDKNSLVTIILVDACFIIELFLRYKGSEEDAHLLCSNKANIILLDLLLLENQLPFFVLENLFSKAMPSSNSTNLPSLLELTVSYFGYFNKQIQKFDGVNICHFTDLLRHFHLQPQSSLQTPCQRINNFEVLHFNASKLHEIGLRFKVNDESQCLLGLKLLGDVLEIPKIEVYDDIEILFRNMVAFEQCHYTFERDITNYFVVFDFLIDTGKDVDVLVRNGIIVSHLNDSDVVAKLFNGLGKNIRHANVNPEYASLCKRLNEFCKSPHQKLKATLRCDYCKTPWQTAASIAGMFLLFLTLIQTIFSGIQVMQQSKNG